MKFFVALSAVAAMLAVSCAVETEAPSVAVELSSHASYTSVCGDTIAFNDETAQRLYEAAQDHIGEPWEGRDWTELTEEERGQWSATLDIFLTNDACEAPAK